MIIVLLALILTVIFGGAYYAYRIAFHSPRKDRERIPSTASPVYDPYRDTMDRVWKELMAHPFEYVTVTSYDGLQLSGRYYHTADGAPLDICFHGYRSSALTDFSGGSSMCFSFGHNVLLVDQRAHGRSQGDHITFGIKERHDVLSWVNFAVDRFGKDTKIVLSGISMGGATVLMASNLDLPKNVKGILADCPYACAEDIIVDVGLKQKFPAAFTRNFGRLGARIYGCFHLNEINAVQAVKNTKVPILIIHGEADSFVPAAMSETIAQANPGMVSRITIPGAEHGISFMHDNETYIAAVRAFMDKVLA